MQLLSWLNFSIGSNKLNETIKLNKEITHTTYFILSPKMNLFDKSDNLFITSKTFQMISRAILLDLVNYYYT